MFHTQKHTSFPYSGPMTIHLRLVRGDPRDTHTRMWSAKQPHKLAQSSSSAQSDRSKHSTALAVESSSGQARPPQWARPSPLHPHTQHGSNARCISLQSDASTWAVSKTTNRLWPFAIGERIWAPSRDKGLTTESHVGFFNTHTTPSHRFSYGLPQQGLRKCHVPV